MDRGYQHLCGGGLSLPIRHRTPIQFKVDVSGQIQTVIEHTTPDPRSRSAIEPVIGHAMIAWLWSWALL